MVLLPVTYKKVRITMSSSRQGWGSGIGLAQIRYKGMSPAVRVRMTPRRGALATDGPMKASMQAHGS